MAKNKVNDGQIPEGAIWLKVVARYNRPEKSRSIFTVLTSVVPLLLLFFVMYRLLRVSVWLTLALSIPTAGFMVRSFIIFHDCGHGSLFASRRWCNILGTVLGVILFTPYYKWSREHAMHHATVGDLDRRGIGDVWILTKVEYLQSSRLRRLAYRVYRNPFFMFGIANIVLFLVLHRFHGVFKSTRGLLSIRRELLSVYGTDLALGALIVFLSLVFGFRAVLIVQLPVLYLASMIGVFLFYIQHQFDGVYWCRRPDWDYATSALRSASAFIMPPVLRWFTGSIGYHTVHHLSPRIPCYKLASCYRENTLFKVCTEVTLGSLLKNLGLALWDEKGRRLIRFRGHHWFTGRVG